MTKYANVSFSTQLQDTPDGVVVGGYAVSLMKDGAPVQALSVGNSLTPIQFVITAPGVYSVQVVRVAESGENVSPVAESAVFTVAPDQITVPLTVTVALADTIDVPAVVTVTA